MERIPESQQLAQPVDGFIRAFLPVPRGVPKYLILKPKESQK